MEVGIRKDQELEWVSAKLEELNEAPVMTIQKTRRMIDKQLSSLKKTSN